jgi:hypothetical protein
VLRLVVELLWRFLLNLYAAKLSGVITIRTNKQSFSTFRRGGDVSGLTKHHVEIELACADSALMTPQTR